MIEDLRSDDPEARLSSMRGLHCIGQTLGPERVRGELLPYLMDYLDDDDEVLRTFAGALGTMLTEVGGINYVDCLFGALETLCTLDEITVREEATQSLSLLARTVFSSEAYTSQQAQFMSLLGRLAKNPEPRARSSATAIIAAGYEASSPQTKKELRAKFVALCSDEEVMVRRAACTAIANNVAAAFGATCNDILQPFSLLCKDPSDSIRLQAIPSAIALLPHLKDSNVSQIISLMKGLSTDNSWRVKYMFADKLPSFVAALPKKDVVKICVPAFKSLCQDTEPEIRASAVFSLPSILASLTDSDTVAKKELLVVAGRLSTDANVHVRSSLSSVVLKATLHLPKDFVSAHIIPMCNDHLKDDEADVRLGLLGSFAEFAEGRQGNDVAQIVAPKLLPVVTSTLSKDSKWRIRETVVRQAPHMIPYLGNEASQLVSVCLDGLYDRVATIRAAAAEGCARLVQQHDAKWASSTIFPHLAKMGQAPSFLPRLTYLQVLQKLAPVIDASTFKDIFLPTVLQLSSDTVPNVRVNVVKTLFAAREARHIQSAEVEALVVRFTVDKDPDVRDAARQRTG